MDSTFKSKLFELFKKDSRLWDKEKKVLNETLLKDLIDKLDAQLLGLLLGNKEARDKFFIKVNDIFVLKQSDLKFFIDENKLDNSYTQYQNTIGLRVGSKLLSERDEVVLDYPFKDCVLEGGMTKEDQKRNEIFFNEILAKDEIDRLEDPKVLVNWKKHTANGEMKVKELKRDKDGTIRDNLIIRGNNLIALASLEKEFTGKIKLIYIDPPYNTGNDDFGYNDSFNHSAWLVFMKNRLEFAKKLLSKSGAIFIQIDHHELGYINVLMDEIFGHENKVQVISVKTAAPAGFKTVNPGPIDVTEYILFYTKSKKDFVFKKQYVPVGYNQNYGLFLEKNIDIKKWKFIPLSEKVLEINGFKSQADAKKKYGDSWSSMQKSLIAQFAFDNAENVVSVRDPHNPTQKTKELMELSKNNGDKVIELKKEDGESMYFYRGGSLAFYSKKIIEIDGERVVTELLTDFWSHISWAGIANEGGVKLKNGKKPEKLLKQIINLSTDKNDIVLDYHLGSGTTCAVAHKMGRQYIGIEQLNYNDNDTLTRLNNVIRGDSTGISKAEKWAGGGEYISLDLAKWNEEAKGKILKAKSYNELAKLFDELYERYFLNYNVKTKLFKEKTLKEDSFKKLDLEEQKNFFVEMLDMNQMYVNFSERSDKKYDLSKDDIALSEQFYNTKK